MTDTNPTKITTRTNGGAPVDWFIAEGEDGALIIWSEDAIAVEPRSDNAVAVTLRHK